MPYQPGGGGVAQTSGTWTPVITPGTSAGDFAATYSVQLGTWVKTGDMVTVSFDVRPATANFTTTTATGTLQLNGLPFTSDGVWAGSFFNFHLIPLGAGYTAANPAITDASTFISLREIGDDIAAAVVQIGDPTTAFIIVSGSIQYKAA